MNGKGRSSKEGACHLFLKGWVVPTSRFLLQISCPNVDMHESVISWYEMHCLGSKQQMCEKGMVEHHPLQGASEESRLVTAEQTGRKNMRRAHCPCFRFSQGASGISVSFTWMRIWSSKRVSLCIQTLKFITVHCMWAPFMELMELSS